VGFREQGPSHPSDKDLSLGTPAGTKGPRKHRILMRDQTLRGIIAYCEEGAVELTANVSREPSGPFRGARQLVARNADKDGEAIVLDLHS
jgi:hypothetical protein